MSARDSGLFPENHQPKFFTRCHRRRFFYFRETFGFFGLHLSGAPREGPAPGGGLSITPRGVDTFYGHKNFFSAWMQSGCNEQDEREHQHRARSQFVRLMRYLGGAQGRSPSYQPRLCKDCCFLSAKSRDTNKNTNTQSGRTSEHHVRFTPKSGHSKRRT